MPAEEEPEEDLICDPSETNPSKTRQKRKILEEALEGEPFTKRYVDLPEDQKVCLECGTLYKRIGEEYLRTEYDIIPPRIRVIKWYSITYQCPKCSGNGVVPAVQRTAYVNKLFMIERDIRFGHLTADEIIERRLQKENLVLKGLWSWLEKQNLEKGTRFDKVVTYICNIRDLLENYLLDERCSFPNNASERAVKQVVIGWKNWLFAVVPSGAQASALIYTMVEMEWANRVNVYQYLIFLLKKCPTSQTSDEELEKLAPWDPGVKRITGERSEALQAE